MTYKDFSWWLEGYLTGKEKLDKGEIASILVMLRDVVEEPKINHIPSHPIPRKDVTFPYPPFNPTCNSDGVYGPGNDNYGRDKWVKDGESEGGRF